GRTAGTHQEKEEEPAIVSPAAQRLMSEHDLPPGSVEGSGRGGRVLKEDVQRVIDAPPAPRQHAEPPPHAAPAALVSAKPAPAPGPRAASSAPAPTPTASAGAIDFPSEDRPQRRVPMTRLRARIAERLVEVQHTAAILTTFNEVNMQPVIQLRQHYRERFEQEHGVKLGFMSFFVKAAVEALKRYPVINASLEGTDIVYHGFFDIGIAVASPRGLVVPVMRD